MLDTSRRPRLVVTVGAVCLLVLTAGCTGTERIDTDGFAAGSCADAASAVEDIDETLIRADEEELSPREAAEQLRVAQDVLKPIRDAAGDPLEQSFTDLITRLGFYRITVVPNSDPAKQLVDARAALDDLVEACTGA